MTRNSRRLLMASLPSPNTSPTPNPSSASPLPPLPTKPRSKPNSNPSPLPDEERRQHRIFTSEPHIAGSKRNNELAEYIRDEWKKQGLEDVIIRRYDVYGTNPKSASLEMIAPTHYQALLREVALDCRSRLKKSRHHRRMARHVDFRGRHSAGRLRPQRQSRRLRSPPQERHQRERQDRAGALFKSLQLSRIQSAHRATRRRGGHPDLQRSAEDGYKKGKVDPDGPWGPEYHIQRGAITYDFMVPGDPLTPGWASVPGAKRIPIEDAVSAPKIMALPLSWHDAKPLLENMDGPVAPPDWQGGLPIQYHLGGERVKAHLKIEMDNGTQPYYVVEGRIRGAELPDEWVVLGNHRDAWVFGGVDPSSGTASMMELTRALGKLAKEGMRPRRTLVVCSWDGEEVGLTGSTEWGEQFADELRSKAVAYINVDEATSGPNFHGQAVASLAPMLVETTRTLQDPSGKILYEVWKATTEREKKEGKQSGQFNDSGATDSGLADTRIGSGSDHTVFLNFIGMPVIGLRIRWRLRRLSLRV